MLSCTDTPILKVYCNTPFFEVPVQRWTFTISLPNFLFSDFYLCLYLYCFFGNATRTPFDCNLSCRIMKCKNKNSKKESFYQKCRLIKALPQWVFKQASKAQAFSLFSKAIAFLIRHGLYFDVCGTSPLLCFSRRDLKSSVQPMQKWVSVASSTRI